MSYRVEPASAFFNALPGMIEYEIRPGNTISFLAEVDLSEAEAIRSCAPGARRPTYTALVAKAAALALREFPYANRRAYRRWWLPFSRRRLQTFHSCDVAFNCERDLPGIEVATFADVLRDVDRLSLEEITAWLQALSVCDLGNNRQWRDFHRVITRLPRWLTALILRAPNWLPGWWAKYRGAALLISSPAKYGVDAILGTWTSPLGLSFGLAKLRAVVREGRVVARPTFLLTLNWHRHVMAGAQAARFFRRIVEILENARAEMKGYYPEAETAAGFGTASSASGEVWREAAGPVSAVGATP